MPDVPLSSLNKERHRNSKKPLYHIEILTCGSDSVTISTLFIGCGASEKVFKDFLLLGKGVH